CPVLLTLSPPVPTSPRPSRSTPPHPPRSTLFPYTTLFRSRRVGRFARRAGRRPRPIRAGPRLQPDGAGGLRLLPVPVPAGARPRSEEHTSELQSPYDLVCRLLLEKKKGPRLGRLALDAARV